MKIRTDFVTNSSSSSFITVIIEQEDGKKVQIENSLDDIGHGVDPEPLCYRDDDYMEKLLGSVHSGKDLLDALDKEYAGMFYDNSADLGAIENLNSFANTKTISITDYWSGDYGFCEKTFVFDCKNKSICSKVNNFENPHSSEYDSLLPELVEEATREFGGELPEKIQDSLESYLSHADPWPKYFHPIFCLVGYLYYSEAVGKDRTMEMLQKYVDDNVLIEDLIDGGSDCDFWD